MFGRWLPQVSGRRTARGACVQQVGLPAVVDATNTVEDACSRHLPLDGRKRNRTLVRDMELQSASPTTNFPIMRAAQMTHSAATWVASWLAVVGCALFLGLIPVGPAQAKTDPRLLLSGALSGAPDRVVFRPKRFAISHYSVSRARWSLWDGESAAGKGLILEEFGGARPKRLRGSIKLSRPAYRCGVYSFTRLYINGELASDLKAYSGICNWVVQ